MYTPVPAPQPRDDDPSADPTAWRSQAASSLVL